MIPKFKTERARRYYLHSKVKDLANLHPTKRTIFCKETDIDNLKTNRYIVSLINEYGYSLQIEI